MPASVIFYVTTLAFKVADSKSWGGRREAGRGVSAWPAKFKALQEHDCGSRGLRAIRQAVSQQRQQYISS